MSEPSAREERYLVFKLSRLNLSAALDQGSLDPLGQTVQDLIDIAGCRPTDAVVVEKGWPQYEAAWKLIEAGEPVVHLPAAPSALPCGDVLATERANAVHNTLREVKKALDAAGVKWVEGYKAPGMNPLFAAPYGKGSS